MVAARLITIVPGMIIVGGEDAAEDILASGMIYDTRTELWTSLLNDMPEPLRSFSIAGNDNMCLSLVA